MVDGLMLVLGVHVYSTKEFPSSGNGKDYSPPLQLCMIMHACILSTCHKYMICFWLLPSNQSLPSNHMGKLLATRGMGDH